MEYVRIAYGVQILVNLRSIALFFKKIHKPNTSYFFKVFVRFGTIEK